MTTIQDSNRRNLTSSAAWVKESKDVLAPLGAGYIAGSCGIIVGHPLDSLKVLLQTGNGNGTFGNSNSVKPNSTTQPPATSSHPVTQPSSSNTSNSNASRTLSSVANRVGQGTPNLEGKRSLRSLYAGVAGPLVTVGLIQSINFAIYDTVRRSLYFYGNRNDPNFNAHDYLYYDSLTNVAISASVAGGAISFVTSPLMVVKTKQQIMLWSMKKAARDTLKHQVRKKLECSPF